MTFLSTNKLFLVVGAFLFIAIIVSFSIVNAQQDNTVKDTSQGQFILAQAPKLLGQKQASQPQVTKSKQDSASGKNALRAKTVTNNDEDDDEDDEDDDEDIQPSKSGPKVISTTSQKPVSKPPSASTPQTTPGQVSAKPIVQPPQQTSPSPVAPPAPPAGRPAIAQPQNTQQQARPQPFVSARPQSSRGSISLNFDDADVYQVIQTILSVLRVNYIVDPRVKGRVTFRSVAPIPTDQVLPVMETILRINAIGVVEDGGLYKCTN